MALADVLAGATVRPVYVAWFDIKDDPIFGWTGPGVFAPTGTGDPDLDGNTFLSAEGAVQSGEFHEDQGIGSEISLVFAVNEDIPGFIVGESEVGDFIGSPGGPVYDQIMVDRRSFLGRRAKIWLFFLDEDEGSALPEYEVLFNGVMVGCAMNRQTGQATTVTLTLDQDTQKRRAPPARLQDHARYYAGDKFTAYLGNLAGGSTAYSGSGSMGGLDPYLHWQYISEQFLTGR